MGNYQQAPKLYYNKSEKEKGKEKGFTYRSIDFEKALMNGCSNLAELKYMLFLTGNIGDGSFRVSEATLKERTGLSNSSISRARKSLEAKGWITCVEGVSITVNCAAILGSQVDTPSNMGNQVDTPQGSQVDTPEGCQVDTHNNIINIPINKNNLNPPSESSNYSRTAPPEEEKSVFIF
jgi:DNA-binding transcriptional MocR family regulator